MTPTHIMLTEQGFVAFQQEYLPTNDPMAELLHDISTANLKGILFAHEEQEKVKQLIFGLTGCPISFAEWQPEKNIPYALPDGVEVEIKELCGHTNRECGDSCDDCNKFPYKRAYLKTKEANEESQDQIIEDLIATWQATCGAITGDEYSEVKRKFKVTRI